MSTPITALREWARTLAKSYPEIGLLYRIAIPPAPLGFPALCLPVRRLWWNGLYLWLGTPMPHDEKVFQAFMATEFKCCRVLDEVSAQIEIEKYLKMDGCCEPVSVQARWPKETT